MTGLVGAIHEVHRTFPIFDTRILVPARKSEAETRKGFVGRLDFDTLYRGVEIVVDGRAIDDAGDLIARVIVEKRAAVQRKRTVQQRVLGAQLVGVYEFRFEGERMDRVDNARRAIVEEGGSGRVGAAGLVTMCK